MSSDFEWDIERSEQALDAGTMCAYDIRAAKEVLVRAPRPVETVSLEGERREFFSEQLDDVGFRHNADWDKVDPDVPVIFATEGGLRLPIDGRHRLAKALREGRPSFPAVTLTEEETQAIRVS